MKFFIDAEFWERPGHPIELISLGVVSGIGTELYVINGDFDWDRQELKEDPSGRWLLEHVEPHIDDVCGIVSTPEEVGKLLAKFVMREVPGEEVEFWGYCSAYDWVVLCQLYGRLVDLPKGFPNYCNDLKQLLFQLGESALPSLPEKPGEHCSILDARWNRESWIALMQFATRNIIEVGEARRDV